MPTTASCPGHIPRPAQASAGAEFHTNSSLCSERFLGTGAYQFASSSSSSGGGGAPLLPAPY